MYHITDETEPRNGNKIIVKEREQKKTGEKVGKIGSQQVRH